MLTPLELLDRLSQLVTPPRLHKHRYFGVLAPNAKLRKKVIESAGSNASARKLERFEWVVGFTIRRDQFASFWPERIAPRPETPHPYSPIIPLRIGSLEREPNMRVSAAGVLLALANTAFAVDFTVSSLDAAPVPAGDPVLELKPDGSPCIAYYSAQAGAIVFADFVDGEFQFELVDSVTSPTEVALAISDSGTVHLAYGNGALHLADRTNGEWSIRQLDDLVDEVSLDLEFTPSGVLGLAYSWGPYLRYLDPNGSAPPVDTLIGARAASVDLEYDSSGGSWIALWVAGSESEWDEQWGTLYCLIRSPWEATFRTETFGHGSRSPSLEFPSSGGPEVSACRFEAGQQLWRRSGNNRWSVVQLQSPASVEVDRSGSALVASDSPGTYLFARSKFMRRRYNHIDGIARVEGAERVGRESAKIAASGLVHAAYVDGSLLRYATFDPSQAPRPVITSVDGPSTVLWGSRATLSWQSEHAGSVLINGNEVEPSGTVSAILNGDTTFRFGAVGFGGTNESDVYYHVGVLPAIRQWSVEPTQIIASEQVRFYRDCVYADSIRIAPLGFASADLEGYVSSRVYETTTFVLSAFNASGVTSDSVTVHVTPFEIRHFSASSASLGTADEVELSWEVHGIANVTIEDVGQVPAIGSIRLVPGRSRDYVLTAEWNGYLRTATVHVEVDDSFLQSHFYLSFEQDAVQPNPPPLAALQLFTVYVLGLSLNGGQIAGVEFGLDYPPELMLLAADLHSPRALNIVDPPDFIVGLGQCYELSDLHLLATLTFMAGNQVTIDEGAVRLRPAVIQSIPGSVAYATCSLDLNGSEIAGPMLQAMHGPPLYLSADRVSAFDLGLRAARSGGEVELRWTALPPGLADRIELAYSTSAIHWLGIAELSGAELARSTWNAPLRVEATSYRLRASRARVVILEETARLDDFSTPARTRLLSAQPSPFGVRTTFHFEAAAGGSFELSIVNAAGRRVRSVRIDIPSAGSFTQTWDGMDDNGRPAANGVYFAQLSGGGHLDRLRVLLLR